MIKNLYTMEFMTLIFMVILFGLDLYLFYISIMGIFISLLINLFILIIAIIILLKVCDMLDNILGLGRYKDKDSN